MIARIGLACYDISKISELPDYGSYPSFILVCEVLSSLPWLLANIIYCFVWCLKKQLFNNDENPACCRRRTIMKVATMTCFPCDCYTDHPAAKQLTRLMFLTGCFVLRLIAFILGASCAGSYSPRCIPYAVVSGVTLVPSFFTMMLEWLHFDIFWSFQPIGTGYPEKRYDHSHLRFFLKKFLKNQRATDLARLQCEEKTICNSKSLHHILLYHSMDRATYRPQETDSSAIVEIIIGFHRTTREDAIKIAHDGFPITDNTRVESKIYFTPFIEESDAAGREEASAIVCARLNLGKNELVKKVNEDSDFNFSRHQKDDPLPQTLYWEAKNRIKVAFPGQIENWIIILKDDDDEQIDPFHYRGCI